MLEKRQPFDSDAVYLSANLGRRCTALCVVYCEVEVTQSVGIGHCEELN